MQSQQEKLFETVNIMLKVCKAAITRCHLHMLLVRHRVDAMHDSLCYLVKSNASVFYSTTQVGRPRIIEYYGYIDDMVCLAETFCRHTRRH